MEANNRVIIDNHINDHFVARIANSSQLDKQLFYVIFIDFIGYFNFIIKGHIELTLL